MTSWRDTASARAQADLDGLLNSAFGFAQQQLAKHGEFFPYALAVQLDGQTELVATRRDPTNDHPASADVIASCVSALTARRHEIRAAAIVAEVWLPDIGSHAIDVALEHVEGQSLVVQLPYSKGRFGKGIHYGQLQAQPGTRRIWTT